MINRPLVSSTISARISIPPPFSSTRMTPATMLPFLCPQQLAFLIHQTVQNFETVTSTPLRSSTLPMRKLSCRLSRPGELDPLLFLETNVASRDRSVGASGSYVDNLQHIDLALQVAFHRHAPGPPQRRCRLDLQPHHSSSEQHVDLTSTGDHTSSTTPYLS